MAVLQRKMDRLIGSIEPLSQDADIDCYLERLEQLFLCNDVKNEAKVPLFLTLVGADAYKLLRDLLAPDLPSAKTYQELSVALKACLAPKRLVIAESFKFYQAEQGELSITDYILSLKRLAKTCEFGAFRERALRDKFVCGLSQGDIQKKLLAELNLTFDRACEIALAMEAAQVGLKELAQSQVVKSVNRPNRPSKSYSSNDQPSYTPSYDAGLKLCGNCGRKHKVNQCRVRNLICNKCHRKGHVAKMCGKKDYKVQTIEDSDDSAEVAKVEICQQTKFAQKVNAPVFMEIKLDRGAKQQFEVDTGSAVSIVSEEVFLEHLSPYYQLKRPSTKLTMVDGKALRTIGSIWVKASLEQRLEQAKYLELFVMASGRSPRTRIIGRQWLNQLIPGWQEAFESRGRVKQIGQKPTSAANFQESFADVFGEDYGKPIKGFEVKLSLIDGAVPVFRRPYSVPFALRQQVEQELSRLEEQGIIELIAYSEWASPVVVVRKKNGAIRLCGDFKATVNPKLKVDQYPLPLIEEVIHGVSQGKWFTTLDMSQAYLQCAVHSESQPLLTINTHVGLFKFCRLPFGVASAPAKFQELMDRVLKGLVGVAWYLDDIVVSGATKEEHDGNLIAVLERLRSHNIKVNYGKSCFFKEEVDLLGFRLNGEGVQPLPERIAAIQKAPSPTNLTEVGAYVGLLNYYRKFVPDASTVLRPLYDLEKKNAKFVWNKEQEAAFQQSKELFLHSKALTHYNPELEIVIATDASPYACGAVMSHIIDGVERPVMFISSSFSKAERNYAQVEKEALAIIVAIKKLHKYIYGRKFTLYTDHKALEYLFGSKKPIPTLAASRLQRWALMLSAYQYEIKYKKGEQMQNADALSRLPLPAQTDVEEVHGIFAYEGSPYSIYDVVSATKTDKVLAKVLEYVGRGWPHRLQEEDLRSYYAKRNELAVENGCIVWGNRLVIPSSLRSEVLQMLHEEHIGIVRMKLLAREHFWWPNMGDDIERTANACDACKEWAPHQPTLSCSSWTPARRAWGRLHIDFLEKYKRYFLIVVDSTSRWIDVQRVRTTNAMETIFRLRSIFSVFGIPDEIVSDNGPPFNGEEYRKFCAANGVRAILTPPMHPRSNGAAEKQVHSVKKCLEKRLGKLGQGPTEMQLQHSLDCFLLKSRTTPNAMTGKCPASMLLRQMPKTRMDLLRPKEFCGRGSKEGSNEERLYQLGKRQFLEGQKVWILNKRGQHDSWIKGRVEKRVSAYTYLVSSGGGVRYVHADDLKPVAEGVLGESQPVSTEPLAAAKGQWSPVPPLGTSAPEPQSREPGESELQEADIETSDTMAQRDEVLPTELRNSDQLSATPQLRRSGRKIRAPDRLDL